jgi:transcription initiation factor TFIIE subunit alpha
MSSEDSLATILAQLVGEDTVSVAQILLEQGEMTDEAIASRLQEKLGKLEPPDVSLKVVRKSLYKLNEKYLASYRRIRDPETGYFIYYWAIQKERLRILILNRRRRTIQVLSQRLSHEERHLLYHCGTPDCPSVTFGAAFEVGFVCSNCNSPLVQQDNEDSIRFLGKRIKSLQENLNEGL